MILELPTVTLLCVDCVDVARAAMAVDRSTDGVKFGAVKLLTSLPTTRTDAVAILPINSLDAYSEFMLRESYRFVDTSHALVAQYDGYVTHPEAWTDKFLDYDYIGAPWMDGRVGNGGFSLRSRTLMVRVSEIVRQVEADFKNEDEVICRELRAMLRYEGYLFAPPHVAARFSVELNASLRTEDTFGFHGKHLMTEAAA